MAEREGQRPDALVAAERHLLDALAGVDALLNPGAADRGGRGLRMIVAERQVRELARGAREDLLDLLAHGSLNDADGRLGVTLVHASHAISAMCDEYVDLSRLADLPVAEDTVIAHALVSMLDLTRGQIRTAAEALGSRNGELAAGLTRVHAAIEALNHQVGDRGLVADDGAVGREAMSSAVLTAECLTRISQQAVDIAEHIVRIADGQSPTPHSPV